MRAPSRSGRPALALCCWVPNFAEAAREGPAAKSDKGFADSIDPGIVAVHVQDDAVGTSDAQASERAGIDVAGGARFGDAEVWAPGADAAPEVAEAHSPARRSGDAVRGGALPGTPTTAEAAGRGGSDADAVGSVAGRGSHDLGIRAWGANDEPERGAARPAVGGGDTQVDDWVSAESSGEEGPALHSHQPARDMRSQNGAGGREQGHTPNRKRDPHAPHVSLRDVLRGSAASCISVDMAASTAAVCGSGGALALLDLVEGRTVRLIEGAVASRGDEGDLEGGADITACCMAWDGTAVVAGDAAGSLAVWGTPEAEVSLRWAGHASAVTGCRLAQRAPVVLATTSAEGVAMWDLARQPGVPTWQGQPGDAAWGLESTCCAVSHDGRLLVTGSDDGRVVLWDPRAGSAHVASLGRQGSGLRDSAGWGGSPGARLRARRGVAGRWELLRDPSLGPIKGVDLAADAPTLVACGLRGVFVFDLRQGGLASAAHWEGVGEEVSKVAAGCCCASPAGDVTVAGDGFGTVGLWRRQGIPPGSAADVVGTWEPTAQLHVGEGDETVVGCEVAVEGGWLAACTLTGDVRVWAAP